MEKVEIHFLTTGNMVQIVLVMAVVIVASIVAYSISEILGTILLIVLVIGILCTR